MFPAIDLFRRMPECIRGLQSGAAGTAPLPIKRWVIAAYLQRHGLRHFVETGTHLGDTLALVARDRLIMCTRLNLRSPIFRQHYVDSPAIRMCGCFRAIVER